MNTKVFFRAIEMHLIMDMPNFIYTNNILPIIKRCELYPNFFLINLIYGKKRWWKRHYQLNNDMFKWKVLKPQPQVLRIGHLIIGYHWMVPTWVVFVDKPSFKFIECSFHPWVFDDRVFTLILKRTPPFTTQKYEKGQED